MGLLEPDGGHRGGDGKADLEQFTSCRPSARSIPDPFVGDLFKAAVSSI
jgi:hypothetical protein